ncbi:conserved exported hypothetical protein [Frankia canadensis]|uniref:Bacterial EndoU nuclease domain-containing protein n=2 Tax=Frankia canadensis TaxID=1836972 RepID=A0A2I2L0D4_9ACTN|nr:conserved exported hypothetical protein [Frankia canadensis]SOU58627.1 conserved exported hypothetical protein [Frankia canadensis]
MKWLRRALLPLLLSLSIALLAAAPAHAEKLGTRPNWGACGVSTSEQKMVYDFGGINLRCGNNRWGYRHIKDGGSGEDGHYDDFQNLARPAGLNWSDLVHWAIYYNTKDPDHVVVDQNTGCRDRLLYAQDGNGRQVWQQRFRMIYNATDGRVITVYPTSGTCQRQ